MPIENVQDLIDIFQYTFLEIFQICLQVVMYLIELISDDILLRFLFQTHPILFVRDCGLHQ